MKFGYARVSTRDQSLDIQVKKLKAAGCDEIYQEKISGTNDDREQFNILLSRLRKGDTLCVVRLDRLGRRMIKLVEFISEFQQKGVEFVSLENNIDTSTPVGMLLFNICAAFSEMERELIRERVVTGINAARDKGRKGGRPKSLNETALKKLMALKKGGGLSVKEICETLDISRSVYYPTISNESNVTPIRNSV